MQATHPAAAEIASAIQGSIASLPGRLGHGRTNHEWTTQLKDDIGSLGVAHGWDVCTSGFPGRFECEWLYDLVWYREDAEGNLAEVYLVLESEWEEAHAAITYDFQKLLLAKSPLKLMVFETNDLHISKLLDRMERGIRAFKTQSADENYIIAAFNNSTHTFEVRQIKGA
jgi:hypothetical protein